MLSANNANRHYFFLSNLYIYFFFFCFIALVKTNTTCTPACHKYTLNIRIYFLNAWIPLSRGISYPKYPLEP